MPNIENMIRHTWFFTPSVFYLGQVFTAAFSNRSLFLAVVLLMALFINYLLKSEVSGTVRFVIKNNFQAVERRSVGTLLLSFILQLYRTSLTLNNSWGKFTFRRPDRISTRKTKRSKWSLNIPRSNSPKDIYLLVNSGHDDLHCFLGFVSPTSESIFNSSIYFIPNRKPEHRLKNLTIMILSKACNKLEHHLSWI